MTREELLKLIQDNLHPCNSCYDKSKKDTAERILDAISEETDKDSNSDAVRVYQNNMRDYINSRKRK